MLTKKRRVKRPPSCQQIWGEKLLRAKSLHHVKTRTIVQGTERKAITEPSIKTKQSMVIRGNWGTNDSERAKRKASRNVGGGTNSFAETKTPTIQPTEPRTKSTPSAGFTGEKKKGGGHKKIKKAIVALAARGPSERCLIRGGGKGIPTLVLRDHYRFFGLSGVMRFSRKKTRSKWTVVGLDNASVKSAKKASSRRIRRRDKGGVGS